MLKVLLKKQLVEIFRGYFYDAKNRRPRTKGATITYFLLFFGVVVVFLGGLFTFLSVAVCSALSEAGMDWLYFALMGSVAILFGIFGSVFNTYAGLYLSRDNDLLLSMPIPVGLIMISRLLGVYLMGLLYSGIVLIPAIIVYWIFGKFGFATVVGGILFLLFVSVFVLTLSCALGWIVAKIASKLRHKAFATVFVSLVLFAAYYFVCFQMQDMVADLIANAALYGDKIKGAAYPLYLFGRAGTGDPVALVVTGAAVAILFALAWFLISRSFLKLATTSGNAAKKEYRETNVKSRGAFSALLRKEFGRFMSSPNYMLNCGLGVLLLPVFGILLLIFGGDFSIILKEILDDYPGVVPVIIFCAVCLLSAMNDIAAPSVSLEGRTISLTQSLPVSSYRILWAKLSVQLLLTGIPALFCAVCGCIIYPYTPIEMIFAAVAPVAFVFCSAFFGMFLGLKMPNLDWTSENAPIKQSACVAIAIFGSAFYAALPVPLYFLFGYRLGTAGFMGCYCIITVLLCVLSGVWLKKKGTRIFEAL